MSVCWERVLGPPVWAGDDTISHEDAAETRRVRSVQMRGLQEAALAGAYGPMLQRNQIAIDGFGAEIWCLFHAQSTIFTRLVQKRECGEPVDVQLCQGRGRRAGQRSASIRAAGLPLGRRASMVVGKATQFSAWTIGPR